MDEDSPNAFFHLITHLISPEYSTSWKVNKFGELAAAEAIHVPKMKKGHSLDLMSGERSGNTTAIQIDPLLSKSDSESKR